MGEYKQKGGFIGALADIGKFTVGLIYYIFQGLYELTIGLFKILPNPNAEKMESIGEYLPSTRKQILWGYAWMYIWACLRIAFYLIIFTFAGPIFMIVGIFYMYIKLAKKYSNRLNELNELNEVN